MQLLLVTEGARHESRGVRNLLKEAGLSIQTRVVDTAIAATQALQTGGYDGVIFDVKLPSRPYWKLIKTLGSACPPFVFITAQPDFAIEAFELGAVDYIIKPMGLERLELALERMEAKGSARPATSASQIVLRDGDNVWLVKPKEIASIQAMQNYCKIHLLSEHVLIRRSLKFLDEKLSPHGFFRISRDWLVNLGYVDKCSVTVARNFKVRLTNGIELDMSRRQTQIFRQLFSL